MATKPTMQSDELKGELARLPDDRAGVVVEVYQYPEVDGNDTAAIRPIGEDPGPEIVMGVPKARALVRAAERDDLEDPREPDHEVPA